MQKTSLSRSAWSEGDAPPPTRCLGVAGTGVDPVTSRFSGARSAN